MAERDDDLAKRLQAEFDAEAVLYQRQLIEDHEIAAVMSKYHDLSDSDSDATVEPADLSSFQDDSQDFFESEPDSDYKPSLMDYTTSGSNSSPCKKMSNSPVSLNQNSAASPSKFKLQKTSTLKSTCSPVRTKRTSSPTSNFKSTHVSSDIDCCDVDSNKNCSPPKMRKLNSELNSGLKAINRENGTKSNNGLISSSSASIHGMSTAGDGRRRPKCKYGSRCFRTNPDHIQQFDHELEDSSKKSQANEESATEQKSCRVKQPENKPLTESARQPVTSTCHKKAIDVFNEFQPVSFFLTKVSGIDVRFNSTGAVSIRDILSPLMGQLEASCQFIYTVLCEAWRTIGHMTSEFNFMFDIPWLVQQYPQQFRDKPLLIVHGEKGREETELKADAVTYPSISFCRATLDMIYGTHHTKMMLLLYDCGMRVVIHTANLVSNDWYQKTQGVWISPVFPKLPKSSAACASSKTVVGDSPTNFKRDLLAYLAAYKALPLAVWQQHIEQHDMCSARVYIVGSVPGRHSGDSKYSWGHMKLRKMLQEAGPEKADVATWTVIGQFSSIGSLGSAPDQWLCSEWLSSLAQCRGTAAASLPASKLQLVYPSKENVRLCLEGYAGGGCLPYSIKTAQKQIYLNNFVRKWGSEGRGRTKAIPHIKTYTRVSPDFSQAAWFLVTSANLSKAAWGALEKQKTQLMIRSYEIGVLFLPQQFGCNGSFPVAKTAVEVCESDRVKLPFPYDLPPPTYQKGDRIWMWDVPCVDLPDTHGNKYCPRL